MPNGTILAHVMPPKRQFNEIYKNQKIDYICDPKPKMR